MGGVILLQEIIFSFISEVISNRINFLISVELRNTLVSTKLKYMNRANKKISSVTGFSNNMASLSMSKKERSIAQILATKFHTEHVTELELEVRLNPSMRDLIINRHVEEPYRRAVKKKWSK
jgi:hypothetical protein